MIFCGHRERMDDIRNRLDWILGEKVKIKAKAILKESMIYRAKISYMYHPLIDLNFIKISVSASRNNYEVKKRTRSICSSRSILIWGTFGKDSYQVIMIVWKSVIEWNFSCCSAWKGYEWSDPHSYFDVIGTSRHGLAQYIRSWLYLKVVFDDVFENVFSYTLDGIGGLANAEWLDRKKINKSMNTVKINSSSVKTNQVHTGWIFWNSHSDPW